jgi:nucleotide-binding universal stress UspA family protein
MGPTLKQSGGSRTPGIIAPADLRAHRILVALDGSECAFRALSAAIDRSREIADTVLHLLMVHQPSDTPDDPGSWRPRRRTQSLATLRSDWILRQAEQRIPIAGPQYLKEVLEGEPAKLIAQRAGQLRCEVIFVGAHGVGRTQNRQLGSVAAQVCALSVVPVRLIK